MKSKRSGPASGEKNKTGLDVAGAVKAMIREQYPQMDDEGAMRLAMLLAKAQLKNENK